MKPLRIIVAVTSWFGFAVCLVLLGISFFPADGIHLSFSSFPKLNAYIVQSGSMEPTIGVGNLIFVMQKPQYEGGDIVTFKSGSDSKMTTTHRIAFSSINEAGAQVFTTRGDANEEIDTTPVAPDQILGKMVFMVPYVGYISQAAKTPWGFILFVVVPATIIVYEEVKSVWRQVRPVMRAVIVRFSKKAREVPQVIESESAIGAGPTRFAAIVPLLLLFVLMAGATGAYYRDHEESNGNVFSAARSYESEPEVSPRAHPTATPDPSPSPRVRELESENETIENLESENAAPISPVIESDPAT